VLTNSDQIHSEKQQIILILLGANLPDPSCKKENQASFALALGSCLVSTHLLNCKVTL